ncbi:hypothetical protein, partial [Xanthomonas sp. SHU 166]|uniref:hypothetical protein n=1 Tax=Xanthomonas sp. SHU 166 TaxID=1591170 RepID=UPI001E5446AB
MAASAAVGDLDRDGEGLQPSNAAIGMPHFKGDAHPLPDSGVAFAPGRGQGQLQRVFAADLAAGAGRAPGRDFWIDRL